MDFTLTEEQQLIRESAARFVTDHGRPKPGASGFDRELWRQMAEMGWVAAGIAEPLGGFGGPIETALIVEELGRGGLAGEFLGAGVLGPQLFLAALTAGHDGLVDAVISGTTILAAAFSEAGARGELAFVRTRAAGDGDGLRLTGEKTLVLGGDAADRLIVSARTSGSDGDQQGISLFLVDPADAGVAIVPTPLVDGSSAATVRLADTPAKLLGEAGAGMAALRSMAERGIAAIVAESVGMMEAVADITAEYFRGRKQFGRLLGEFQALQHKLADMTIDAEMARANLFVALAAFELDPGHLRERRFAGAKALTGEALRRVTGAGVQAHGGMGMTVEYPVGRYLQRMTALDAVLGAPTHHLSVCARSLAA